MSAENVEIPEEVAYWDQAIGDEKLLRYLTGDQSTPYDEGTAVVITSAEVKVDSVELSYEINENDATTRTVPAVGARAADPHMEAIFVPSKIVRDLGFQLQPEELIVDPTLRRVTVQEQKRLDDRLDDAVAKAYVERGFDRVAARRRGGLPCRPRVRADRRLRKGRASGSGPEAGG
ncbi:hypothetical protein [Nonomuraea sp. NPDC049028]|uniref:hypothetical protein n=1 Tax=Nonomuraea sp. NPDC049028 TaxID=3364348 RepID=UPI003715008D